MKIGKRILLAAAAFSLYGASFGPLNQPVFLQTVAAAETPTIVIVNAQPGSEYKAYKIFDVAKTPQNPDERLTYTISSDSAWFSYIERYVQENAGSGLALQKQENGSWKVMGKRGTTDPFVPAHFASYIQSILKDEKLSEEEKENLEKTAIRAEAKENGELTINLSQETSSGIGGQGYYYVNTATGSLASLTTAINRVEITDKNEMGFDKTVDDDTVNLGQEIQYTITGKIPDAQGSLHYIYRVSDTLSQGLTFGKDVEVWLEAPNGNKAKVKLFFTNIEKATNKIKEGTWLEDREIFYTDNGFVLNLDFTSAEPVAVQDGEETTNLRYADYAGGTIEIIYKAVVNEKAIESGAQNINSAKLEYGPDPHELQEATDQEPVFTANITIDKFAKGAMDTKLAGAQFRLFRYKEENGQVRKPEGADLNTGIREYYVLTKTDEGASVVTWMDEKTIEDLNKVTVATTDSEGTAVFAGLEADRIYYLEEVKAPDGYNELNEPVAVLVDRGWETNSNGQLIEITSQIPNGTGHELPQTGGQGTVGLYAISILLLAGGAGMLVWRKKSTPKA